MLEIIGIIGIIIIFGFLIFMPIYVYFDAKARGKEHPGIWAIASWFSPLVWIYWLVIRPKKKGRE